MTVPERMEALKRAYADMILNTAKEAATRVMASELKARRLEKDLIATKEEAARVLLRLKQMIDVKTKEAEITFLIQQRKVDELESQLNEAEGIILDLRAELNQAQEQLDEAKNKTLHPLRQNENEQECDITPKDKVCGHELSVASLDSGPELVTADGECCPVEQIAKSVSECHVYLGDKHHSMTPIKEPDLFRNRCTQRICATVMSLVNENLPLGDNSGPCDSSTNPENRNVVGNTPVLEEKVQQEENKNVSVIRRSLRKRKLKSWDDVIGALSHKFKKARHAIPSLSCCKTNKVKHFVESGDLMKKEDKSKTQIEKSLDCVAENPNTELGHIENLPNKDLELIHVPLKQDEISEMFKLNSSSKLDCDVKCASATEASNLCHADRKRIFKYTFSRRRKMESMIHPEKIEKNGLRKSPRVKQNGNSGFQGSRLLTKSSRDRRSLVQIAHQLISLSERGGDTS